MSSYDWWRDAIVARIQLVRQSSNLKKRLLIALGGVTSFCVLRYVFWKIYNRLKGYPDGPLGAIPFLGCLPSFGGTPFAFLAHSGATYGALTYFPLLLSNNVLISDPIVLRQLYKAEKLLDRPHHYSRFVAELAVVNGAKWELRRRLMMKTVMNLANSAFVLSKVQQTITDYIEPIMDEQHVKGGALWFPRHFAAHIAFNNVWSAVFGMPLALDDPFIPKFVQAVDTFFAGGSVNLLLGLTHNFTNPRLLDPLKWHITFKNGVAIDLLVEAWMNTHGFVVDQERNLLSRRDGNPRPGETDLLYIDVLIEAVHEAQLTVADAMSDLELVAEAATDTTSNSSEYMFLLLAKHPEIQEMVYDELQAAMKKNGLKTFEFRILTELHVFRAFIYEGLRISTVTPSGALPRIAHRDVQIEVDGKQRFIPKGTLCHANTYYMHKFLDWNNNNQALKEANNEIHLEYWLDADKKFKMNENFVLFGVGRRDCVGQSLAMRALYAIFGLMMCKYKFVAPNNDPACIEIQQTIRIVANIEPPVGIRVQKR